MTTTITQPTGVERHFDEHEIIVSKTDTKGIITYANRVVLRVAGYTEDEVLGQPHNLIRHPAMPRCVFKLLWDTLKAGEEIFAYVINQAKSGDHYWVLAHVTPTFDDRGKIVGYHSSRRVPNRKSVDTAMGLYAQLLKAEKDAGDGAAGMRVSFDMMLKVLADAKMEYAEFAFSI